jgi:hypothetical protein
MSVRVYVSEELRPDIERFVRETKIHMELVDDLQSSDLGILVSVDKNDKKMCDTKTLHSGGWIKCPTAWAIAKKHGLDLMQLGSLLDMLDIRIRQCALGCFE